MFDNDLGSPLFSPGESVDILNSSYNFVSGPEGSRFAMTFFVTDTLTEDEIEYVCDVISDNLLFRISKVE